MLHISIHAGPLKDVSPFNELAICDIGYEALAPVADYTGRYIDDSPRGFAPVTLKNYPRWSASLWDLTARVLALSFHPDEGQPQEEVVSVMQASGAFAQCISAIIEHVTPDDSRRTTLATAEINLVNRRDRQYVARFEEHTRKAVTTEKFIFSPAYLHPGELLLHACATMLTGAAALPPRPALCLPPAVAVGDTPHIRIDELVEPARTGFLLWCACQRGIDTMLGLATEALYVRFLREAV